MKFRYYKTGDFKKIRDLLSSSHQEKGHQGNWFIDRWNFCRTVSQTMHDTYDTWEKMVGVWEDENGNINAVVNSEGEGRGEAFFQIRHPLPKDILGKMFDFAESRLALKENDKSIIRLRIPHGDSTRECIAESRGYVKSNEEETISVLHLQGQRDIKVPEGYCIRAGHEVSCHKKATAHAKAFHYYDVNRDTAVPLAFERMKQALDYCPEFDLAVVNTSGEIVSFCTLWYDALNKHGILEPVGTLPEYRKMGLGRAVIGEVCNRIVRFGANSVYVGSSQDFYTAIGFRPVYTYCVWEKCWDRTSEI